MHAAPPGTSSGHGADGGDRRSALQLLLRQAAAVKPLKRRRRGDEEAVHETRVALRRLRELLVCMVPLLPRRELRRVEARMRGALRMLGGVRDADVALRLCTQHIAAAACDAEREFFFGLFAAIEEERTAAQQRLDHARLRIRRIRGEVSDLARRLRGKGAPPREFFVRAVAAGRRSVLREARLASGPEDAEALHALRLRAKHLRYLLESRATTAAPGVVEVCTSLQRLLGDFHDLHLMRQRIERALSGPRPALDDASARKLLGRLDAELADLYARSRAVLADPRLTRIDPHPPQCPR